MQQRWESKMQKASTAVCLVSTVRKDLSRLINLPSALGSDSLLFRTIRMDQSQQRNLARGLQSSVPLSLSHRNHAVGDTYNVSFTTSRQTHLVAFHRLTETPGQLHRSFSQKKWGRSSNSAKVNAGAAIHRATNLRGWAVWQSN